MKIAALIFLVLGVSAALFGFVGASWYAARIVCWILLGLAGASYMASQLVSRFGRD